MITCNSYYGEYRTRKFSEIFNSDSSLVEFYNIFPPANSTVLNSKEGKLTELSSEDISIIFYLLYANYGNSHIAFSDENQFKFSLCTIIWQYGPTWKKRLDIQSIIRQLSEDELIAGGRAIYNHAYNPSTAPSTGTLEELTTINDQNTTNYKKSKIEAYTAIWDLLDTDVSREFIDKFKKLFITVTAPDYPLLYETKENEYDE